MRRRQPIALTIAGSDSGGGAGIQADLKVFAALGVHGATAITAVTVQNPVEVRSVHLVPTGVVQAQVACVWAQLPPRAVKTGMLGDARTVRGVAQTLQQFPRVPMVIDPVMISTSGKRLLTKSAVSAMKESLFPLASLVTPNRAEAECLLGITIASTDDLRSAAREFWTRFKVPVVLKGGHVASGSLAIDVFWDGRREICLESRYIPHLKTHGTGCTFSAAITAFLARGYSLRRAVEAAKAYTAAAIEASVRVGRFTALGAGLVGSVAMPSQSVVEL